MGHASMNSDGERCWYTASGETTKKQMEEAWAEYYSAQIRRDEDNINWNREYFPGTNKMMDSISNVVYDYWLDRVKQIFSE